MTDSNWTVLILVATAILLLVWDIYVAYFNDEKNDTISSIVYRSALQHPLLPFGIGVIMGHLFWPQ